MDFVRKIRLAKQATFRLPLDIGIHDLVDHPVERFACVIDCDSALAGKTAVWGAKPLNYNHFKIPLMKNLVQRAIRGA